MKMSESFLQGYLRFFDLIKLNLLALLFCLPVVTAGASLTALHVVSRKVLRREEGYVRRDFMRAFRENMKPATAAWLIVLGLAALLVLNLAIVRRFPETFPAAFRFLFGALLYLLFFFSQLLFPLLGRFENPLRVTIKNTIRLALACAPRVVVMTVLWIVPFALAVRFVLFVPVVLLFGFSVPAALCAQLYDPVFRKLETQFESSQAPRPDAR